VASHRSHWQRPPTILARFDPNLTSEDLAQVPVTVDGKVREVLSIPVEASEADAREQAIAQTRVQQFLEGREVVRSCMCQGRY